MKRICTFCFMILFLLGSFTARGDVAYEPPETNFYRHHEQECTRVERYYYTNGAEGYISLRYAPDGMLSRYITNARKVNVFCTYGDWAMITHLNSTELDTPGWVELSELYLIYDEQSFREEHADEITGFSKALLLPEGEKEIFIYDYPGAKSPWKFSPDPAVTDLGFRQQYTDSEGRLWASVSYYQGIRGKWVCLSEPCSLIPPFGGDPNLEQFEKPSMDDGSTATDEKNDVSIRAEEPPSRLPLPPMLPLAIGLVVLAVAGAVVLITVCYKKKGK